MYLLPLKLEWLPKIPRMILKSWGSEKTIVELPEAPLKMEELILQCLQYENWGDYY